MRIEIRGIPPFAKKLEGPRISYCAAPAMAACAAFLKESRTLEFLHFSGPKAAPDTKSCSIIPSGCRIWLEKTMALYQGMAFSHAAHC